MNQALEEFMKRAKEHLEARKRDDPMNIKRYEASDSMLESETGEMVRYEDHLKVVELLKNKINKAYQDGKSDSVPECSWRL